MFVAKPIYSITPFTLLDYPDKTACIIWFAGCNMKCVYCYNPEIVRGEGKLTIDEALKFLKSRINLIDAVVLSGGESTQFDDLENFAVKIKQLGMLVKIDTNGSNPAVIKSFIDRGLVDYVALDFKALADDYFSITQSKLFTRFINTLELLISSAVTFEIRTTVHSELISNSKLTEMIDLVYEKGYRGNYYIQNFVNDCKTIGMLENSYLKVPPINYPASDLMVISRN
ncbi:MAG: anaerobic ribonucleoside-triphosphate reductase activating protein [Bacteroidetes bacterium]|nr:anaerobic ribonucleoside-triphosphate reductase activating protein [Bacteroidota bacterium]